MRLVAIDFETADSGADSACAVALVAVEGGRVGPVEHRLIRPPRARFAFTWLHGIAWHQVGFAFDVAFLDCQLDYSSFFGMKLNKVRFTGSRLKEVAFIDAVAKGAHFGGCDLGGAVFSHSDLSRADFSGAQGYDIDVTQNQVKGAVFELPEAVRLLSYFGIRLK